MLKNILLALLGVAVLIGMGYISVLMYHGIERYNGYEMPIPKFSFVVLAIMAWIEIAIVAGCAIAGIVYMIRAG